MDKISSLITKMGMLSLLSHLFKKKKASDIIASFDSNINNI